MIIDSHAHIFSSKIIAGVSARSAMVEKLNLHASFAKGRTDISSLRDDCRSSGIEACLILPTADAASVNKINTAFIELAAGSNFLFTAGTLHPFYGENLNELSRLHEHGVRAIKLCSFSQGFALSAPETQDLFKIIESASLLKNGRTFVILDTFYLAHEYFGTPEHHTTTPRLLSDIVRKYPGIDFVAAHMGGLAAPPEEIFTHLVPSKNLYLDTSNAAHTLSEKDFLRLLETHGPEHIIFGTDWPWFDHKEELSIIGRLLDLAGYNGEEKEKVFYRNIAGRLGIT
ncbi:MAG: amidohydrolase family protein [Desulfobacterales bacterium]|nr:amidohydrolase family protein [Desulfobacterales bacterium]